MKIIDYFLRKYHISNVAITLADDSEKLFLTVSGSGKKLPLSYAINTLENIGICIYQCRLVDGDEDSWDFIFDIVDAPEALRNDKHLRIDIESTIKDIFLGLLEDDMLNKLLLLTHITNRHLLLIRSLRAYLQQINPIFSTFSINECLIRNSDFAEVAVDYFNQKFNPDIQERQKGMALIGKRLEECMEGILSRDEDVICRTVYSVIQSTVRTNFYKSKHNLFDFALVLKILPSGISDIPKPIPAFECFVYHPLIEGVHLRGGKVARGGIRFSDRCDDYRVEILGLLKAQLVKNSVIVPVGAKGGFVCKASLSSLPKEEYRLFVRESYELFIRALLDVVDNNKADNVTTPKYIVKYDDDDPYFVVAADKGTATFSDFANHIAQEYDYWLGDAFASGGCNGYDHKKMGITARGAWESAKRLMSELGIDTNNETFSVAAIGDMSGDVFGNGMLLSHHIQLLAAFNHQHIFIDPNPSPSVSFLERKRLFEMPHSSWADYDKSIISSGGGVFERTQKTITLSEEARDRLGLTIKTISPDKLISTILKMPVDMLWNGGVGTYVKATNETNADVGDKSNDRLRIDAQDLRAKTVVEGGNLGITQRARIEYALAGGLIHMDAVDNAAGVDCSDHEVNIKVLLDGLVKQGTLASEKRNRILLTMSESVAESVLTNNFRQSKMLSQSNYTAPRFSRSFTELIDSLEGDGSFDRTLACIPSREQLVDRFGAGKALTRPEIATLFAYSKTRIFNQLVDSNLIDDPFFKDLLLDYFPKNLSQNYPEAIKNHPLRKEILASYITNDIVNRMGATFCNYIIAEGGADTVSVVRAYFIVTKVLDVESLDEWIDSLVGQVDHKILLELQLAMYYPIDKAISWLVTQDFEGDIYQVVESCREILRNFLGDDAGYLPKLYEDKVRAMVANDIHRGIDRNLSKKIRILPYCYYVFPLFAFSKKSPHSVDLMLSEFFWSGSELGIFWLYEFIQDIDIDNDWKKANKKITYNKIECFHIDILKHFIKLKAERKVTEFQSCFDQYLSVLASAKDKPCKDFSMVSVLVEQLNYSVSSMNRQAV